MTGFSLDLVMIVRNEARSLARCLRSVKPWVDRMIVVDTGSSDETVAIALAEGAVVEYFTWCDDFAAARNHALACSAADWRLILDADEWLAQGGEALRACLTAMPFEGLVHIDNEFDVPGGKNFGLSTGLVARLIPRITRFAGRIHEQPVPAMPQKILPIRLGHDGYRDAQKATKRERDHNLLTQALAVTPDDAYLNYQMGKWQEGEGAYTAATRHYAIADMNAQPQHPWRCDLVVRWLHCLSISGEHEKAVTLAGECFDAYAGSTDFNFVVGTVMLNWAAAQPARAEEALPLAEASWERCLALGEQPDHIGAVRGRGSVWAAWNLKVLREPMQAVAESTPCS